MKREPPPETIVQPVVSIALATCNAGTFLHAQMASLLAQTGPDIEIVIADDGSDDGTFEHLHDYATRDRRIRLLPQSRRSGFNRNFIRCFRACRGRWISPCDQDDVWAPDKTATLLAACAGDGLAFCDSRFIDAEGAAPESGPTRMSDTRRMDDDPPLLGLLQANPVSGHALMFPAAMLEHFSDVPEASFFDWWIVVVARARGLPLRYVDEPLVAYRRHARAVTANDPGAPRGISKRALLRARYANAHALVHSPCLGDQPEAHAYLRALEDWLSRSIPVAAVGFFWRCRRSVFWTTSGRQWPALSALKFAAGYPLRRVVRPHRHPALRGIENGNLDFE